MHPWMIDGEEESGRVDVKKANGIILVKTSGFLISLQNQGSPLHDTCILKVHHMLVGGRKAIFTSDFFLNRVKVS